MRVLFTVYNQIDILMYIYRDVCRLPIIIINIILYYCILYILLYYYDIYYYVPNLDLECQLYYSYSIHVFTLD